MSKHENKLYFFIYQLFQKMQAKILRRTFKKELILGLLFPVLDEEELLLFLPPDVDLVELLLLLLLFVLLLLLLRLGCFTSEPA